MRAVIFVSILAASACVANAEEASGDPEAAPVHTHEVCSRCHAVTAEQARQRMIAIAPDFQAIANTPGLTATALRAFLQTPHPKMPNLIPHAGAISRCDRLPTQPAGPPTTGYKALNTN